MSLNIVIIGAGEVGYNLARSLSKNEYEITVVDIDPVKCIRVKENIDALVIEGDGGSQRVLQNIDMSKVDYLLAMTRVDEVNLVASRMARKMGAAHIICRLRNTEYQHKDAIITPKQFGIDFVTYPEKAAKEEIEMLVRQSSSSEIQKFKNGQFTLIGIKLETSSPLIGRTVQSVELANPFVHHKLVVINRKDKTFIPHNNTRYKKDDIAYFFTKSTDINKVQQIAGKPAIDINNIMILGAGKIGRLLAKSLEPDYNVRLIEKNKDKAERVGINYPGILLLNGSGIDIEFLESENISEVDCFIAVTENEQTNILSTMLARDLGAKQTIVHIVTTNYLPAVRRIGVDAIVSKNISAVNEVVKYIHSDKSLSISHFEDIDVEVLELSVSEESKVSRKKYTIDQLPEDIRVGGIIRGGKAIILDQIGHIMPSDDIIVFVKEESIVKAKNLFQ
tara:strand:+ start:1390 stop:2736 length:1347 start_codon:yes stop_codon:yes gene_type:complete